LESCKGEGSPPRQSVLPQAGQSFARDVEAFWVSRGFVSVYGGNSFETKKPDPARQHTLLAEDWRPDEEKRV